MQNSSSASDKFISKAHVIWIVLIVLLVGYSRYVPLDHPSLLNFSPALAVFLFCGAYLRGFLNWMAPLLAIVLSDVLLNPSYGKTFFEPFMLVTLGSYILIWRLGKKMGTKRNAFTWTGGAVLSALLFHMITCSFAWVVNPAYNKTISGLFQALTLGEPGFTPAYLFLRNSLLSTVFFALCLRFSYNFILTPGTIGLKLRSSFQPSDASH